MLSGDSGGPLLIPDAPGDDIEKGRPELHLDVLVGIFSFGENSQCQKEKPVVFTRISAVKDWMQNLFKVCFEMWRIINFIQSHDSAVCYSIPQHAGERIYWNNLNCSQPQYMNFYRLPELCG